MVFTSIGLTANTTFKPSTNCSGRKASTDRAVLSSQQLTLFADGLAPVVLGGGADERDMLAFRDRNRHW